MARAWSRRRAPRGAGLARTARQGGGSECGVDPVRGAVALAGEWEQAKGLLGSLPSQSVTLIHRDTAHLHVALGLSWR